MKSVTTFYFQQPHPTCISYNHEIHHAYHPGAPKMFFGYLYFFFRINSYSPRLPSVQYVVNMTSETLPATLSTSPTTYADYEPPLTPADNGRFSSPCMMWWPTDLKRHCCFYVYWWRIQCVITFAYVFIWEYNEIWIWENMKIFYKFKLLTWEAQ